MPILRIYTTLLLYFYKMIILWSFNVFCNILIIKAHEVDEIVSRLD